MEVSLILTIGSIVVLLVLSGFFSGSETALTAASRARLYHLQKRGNQRARTVNRLMGDRERLIGAILLGNNLVNILASALATGALIQLVGDAGVAYAAAIMTLLVLIFAEIMPKSYAINHADRTALAVAPAVGLFVRALSPITLAMQITVNFILRSFGADVKKRRALVSAAEEIRGVIGLYSREGQIAKHERYMLESILDLSALEVSEIMVHRKNMVMIDADQRPSKIVAQVLDSPYTRIPLWRGEPENIIGVLHVKDLLRAVQSHAGDLDKLKIVDLAMPPWFVPESTIVAHQLNSFLHRQIHFSIVVDEYGALMGVVTLEDILEEIVGDIADEYDISVSGVRQEPDGSYVVRGSVTIRDLNRRLDWELPDEEAATIAGLVIHEAQVIPEVGQIFTFHNFKFEVLRRQRNQVTSLRITAPPVEEDTSEA